MKRLLLVFILIGLAGACAKLGTHKQRTREIESFFSQERTGENPDYMLVQKTLYDSSSVAVVYGYADNRKFCQDIVEIITRTKQDLMYFCTAAN